MAMMLHGGWSTIIIALLYWAVLVTVPAIVIVIWARWLVKLRSKGHEGRRK